jgi:protein SCO1
VDPATRPEDAMKKLALLALALLLLGACTKPPQLDDLGTVPEWTATSQAGTAIGTEQLAGKPYVVNFMFTSCPSSCPPLAKATADLQTRVKRWSPTAPHAAHLVTITVDPENDTPEKLAAFGETYEADPAMWKMARSKDYLEMENLVTKGFFLPIMRRDLLKAKTDEERLALLKQPTPLDTAHSVSFMLIDANGHIRGRFAKADADLDRLDAALKHLAGQ